MQDLALNLAVAGFDTTAWSFLALLVLPPLAAHMLYARPPQPTHLGDAACGEQDVQSAAWLLKLFTWACCTLDCAGESLPGCCRSCYRSCPSAAYSACGRSSSR